MVIYWLYSLLLTAAFIILCPYYVWRALRTKRCFRSLSQRFGFVPSLDPDTPVVWIHTASVGETLAIQSLVEAIQKELTKVTLVISTVTDTGQAVARSRYGHVAQIVYFPLDWRFAVKRAIQKLNPSVVLIVETEIWPNFLHVCQQRGIPCILTSGRVSLKSYRRYKLVKPLMKRWLACFHLLLMQTERDALRVLELGAEAARVEIIGSLKLDVKPPADEAALAARLDALLALSKAEHVIIAGSTSDGEENVILNAFRTMKSKYSSLSGARLVLAPRKPDRFKEVERVIVRSGFTHVKRSQASGTEVDKKAEVILLDSVGELALLYSFAQVAILGGTLLGSAAHNYVEPVQRGACVIVGPGYDRGDHEEGVFISLSDVELRAIPDTLADLLQNILVNDETRTQLVSKARELVESSQGATLRVMSHLSNLLTNEACHPQGSHVGSLQAKDGL